MRVACEDGKERRILRDAGAGFILVVSGVKECLDERGASLMHCSVGHVASKLDRTDSETMKFFALLRRIAKEVG